eukprot:SAG22_NODE_11_length_35583_cov_107.128790_32_plen_510_part_00
MHAVRATPAGGGRRCTVRDLLTSSLQEAAVTMPAWAASHAEAAAMVGLVVVLVAWMVHPLAPPPSAESPQHAYAHAHSPSKAALIDMMAVAAFAALCIRALKGPGSAPHCRRDEGTGSAPGSDPDCRDEGTGLHMRPIRAQRLLAPPPPADARSISYSPFRGSAVVPGGAPLPAARSVADRLDDTISVLDFIPQRLHAAILASLHLNQGNEDVTKYIQAALDFVGCNTTKPRVGPIATRSAGSLYFPGGCYFISNLHINASMKIAGEFLDNTTLFAVPGTTGPMLQDKGDAAKITIQDIMVHGGDELGVVAGIQLGCFTGQPGASPWGTYAYLTNVESRNIPKGAGIRLKVNVCTMVRAGTAPPALTTACLVVGHIPSLPPPGAHAAHAYLARRLLPTLVVQYNVWTAGTNDGILNLSGGVALFAFGCGAAGFTGTVCILLVGTLKENLTPRASKISHCPSHCPSHLQVQVSCCSSRTIGAALRWRHRRRGRLRYCCKVQQRSTASSSR